MKRKKSQGIAVAIATLDNWQLRLAARACAIAMVGFTVIHGAARSGAFDDESNPWSKLPGRVASVVGLAADEIEINGIGQHDPQEVLAAVDVKPGASLLGFDASLARKRLETLPWLESASVAREYPNMLKIKIKERVAVAIWQHAGNYDLIDANGVTMGQPSVSVIRKLPLVTGDGANTAVADYINQMSAIAGLSQHVSAAARVGGRRWTLYLDSGIKVALPEQGVEQALKQVWDLDQSQAILSKGISMVDMRVPGRMTLQVAAAEDAGQVPKPQEKTN
jgi:cell division protein FtsQ